MKWKKPKTVSKRQAVHYRLLKHYDILKIEIIPSTAEFFAGEKYIAPLNGGKEKIHYYICYKVFNIIHEIHLAIDDKAIESSIQKYYYWFNNGLLEIVWSLPEETNV